MRRKPIVIDMFCGAGGESVGIKRSMPNIELHAINHWERAIETHAVNFPSARHHCESIENVDPMKIVPGRRIALLWASPECTHHSNARGGKPRSNQSRASAWLVLKWLQELYVERVIIENVPEFISWGPLGADGRPLKSKNGLTFKAFIRSIQSLGYRVEWRILCCADYGSPTTRKRLFIQAVRGHKRIIWPSPTHTKEASLFGDQKWIPARDIIDWSFPSNSIFDRKKPLAENTIKRIEAGIKRYWGEWAEPFLVILRGTSKIRGIDQPCPTITAGGGHIGLVEPFVVQSEHGIRTHSLNKPMPTVTCSSRGFGVVQPFMVKYHGNHAGKKDGYDRNHVIDEPIPTLDTSNRLGIVEPFIIKYYGTGKALAITETLDTVTTRDRFALIDGDPYYLDIRFRMLQPHELSAAQGFPPDYVFIGTKTEQVRQIGNAVPPDVAEALTARRIS